VLNPAKKDIKRNTNQRSTADPLGFLFQEETDQKWKKNQSGEDQVNDEEEVPGEPMLKKGRKYHRPIRCEKIEDDMTDQNRETDLIKIPEVGTP